MINRVFRRLKFHLLASGIKSYEQLKNVKTFHLPDDNMIAENKALLKAYYERYVTEISSANMAASIELAAFMLSICKLNRYKKLLDLGSGLSSFVFRLYAKEHLDVDVWSVDDDALWLEKTKSFLAEYQLDIKNVLTLDAFLQRNEVGFDCVLHDLNFVEVRINYIERIAELTASGGIIILDDVHKNDYLFALLQRLKKVPVKLFDIKTVTHDRYGRFSLAAIKE